MQSNFLFLHVAYLRFFIQFSTAAVYHSVVIVITVRLALWQKCRRLLMPTRPVLVAQNLAKAT